MKATITGKNVQVVIQNLETTDARVIVAAKTGLARALQFAVGQAGTTFMSGPSKTMLGVRTGRLRGALAQEVVQSGDKITGRAGNNMPYAAFHEFGFKGTEQVRAHTRVIGWRGKGGEVLPTRRTVRNRDGIPIFSVDQRPAEVRLGLSGFKSLQQVKAHGRKINYAGRPFLRPALEATDFGGEINTELKKL